MLVVKFKKLVDGNFVENKRNYNLYQILDLVTDVRKQREVLFVTIRIRGEEGTYMHGSFDKMLQILVNEYVRAYEGKLVDLQIKKDSEYIDVLDNFVSFIFNNLQQ